MRTILYISIISLLFFGCKKEHRYEEDPKASRATPQERLNGFWKITGYTFNGVDIYSKLNQQATTSYNLNNILFNYLHKSEKDVNYSHAGDSFTINPFFTQYDNFNDYNYLKISQHGCNDFKDSLFNYWFVTPQSYCANTTAYWKVTKLYEEDFHIVLKTDSGDYKITLIKTKL